MQKIIDTKSMHKGPVEHYIQNYDHVPLWVLIKYFTIGNVSYFYDILDNQLKNKIAQEFSIKFNNEYKNLYSKIIKLSAEDLSGILKVVNLTRNICAHGERIYDIRFSNVRYRNIQNYLDVYFSNDRLSTVVVMLKFVVSKTDYEIFMKYLKSNLSKYSNLITTIDYYKVLSKTGITDNLLDVL